MRSKSTKLEHCLFLLCLAPACIGLGGVAASAEPAVRIGGTGAANEILRLLGEAFQAETQVPVQIVPNLGSSGGLRAVADGVLDLAVSGRPLKPEESALGLKPLASFRTPYALVTSHKLPMALNSADLAALYQNPKAAWPDGTPVGLVIRPRSDSDTQTLGELAPGMAAALEAVRRRPEVPTAATDQDNAVAAERLPASLTGMTLLQLATERPALRAVTLDGVGPSLEALEAGRYGHAKLLFFVMRDSGPPAARRFIGFVSARDGEAARLLRAAQTVVVDPLSP